jgi:hypothetical protein
MHPLDCIAQPFGSPCRRRQIDPGMISANPSPP